MSRLVLISTGSRGIGAATALLAARQGYAVAESIVWLLGPQASGTTGALRDVTGGR